MSTQPAIQIKIDSASVLSQLREVGESHEGPFILSRTINLIGKETQKALREEETRTLKLRHKGWVLQQVKIMPDQWSSKTKLSVKIQLSEKSAFISHMETGDTRTPAHGHWLLVPNDKVFKNKVIGKDDPLNLHKLNFHSTPSGLKGDNRTFMIKSAAGTPLILQRVGKDEKGKAKRGRDKSTGLRLLYYGIRQAKIPKKMRWYEIANATVATSQYDIFSAVLKKALADGKKS